MIELDEIARFLSVRGRKGEQTLSTLGRHRDTIQALKTPIGKELLGGLARRHEELLEKIAELVATPEESIEYNVVRRMLIEWGQKVHTYAKLIGQIKEVSKGVEEHVKG